MKQFGTIFSFELKHYFKDKTFVGITLALVIIMAIVMCFPRVSEALESDDEMDSDSPLPVMLVKASDTADRDMMFNLFESAFLNYDVRYSEDDIPQIKQQITAGDVDCAFVLADDGSYTYYVDTLSLNDDNTFVAEQLLVKLLQMKEMTGYGLGMDQAAGIAGMQVSGKVENLGKDQTHNFFYTYLMVMALYIVIMMYGQMVANNVASEKSSRAMELLVTSTDPVAMLFGKVLASSLAGFIQLLALFGSALLFYDLNRSYWAGSEIISSLFDIPPLLLCFLLLFFILGFLIYAFLYGAIGSTVSKLEDVGSAVGPVALLFMACFFVVIFSLAFGSVDSTLMKVCSYIPFSAPITMFTRIAMSNVPWYGIAASISIQVLSVVLIGLLAAKTYRVGVLLYGTRPKIGELVKLLREA